MKTKMCMNLKNFYFTMACAFIILLSGTAMAQPQPPDLRVINGKLTYLSWTEVADATGYTLSFAPTSSADSASIVSLDMETQNNLTGKIPEGTSFYAAVQARDNTGVSQYSNVVLIGDDGTTLKQIIVFGRHSIRAPVATTASMAPFAADPYPDFADVQNGYLTPRGQQAATLMGSYFHDYLLNEGLLTGDATTDLSHSHFRANSIQRSNITASKFGEGLIPGAIIPVHSYRIADGSTRAETDPVFDPILAKVATVDPARALAETRGIFGTGTAMAAAYSGELSLISNVLYPPGTQPTTDALSGSVDPTSLPITFTANTSVLYTGGVIQVSGLHEIASATDPFIMQYADNFPLEDVAWGRLSLDALSQQTRLTNLFFNIALLSPYLNQVQSSNAGSHVLRTMKQVVTGDEMPGAFGDPESRSVVVISSDAYVIGLAGLLKMHWTLPGYQPDFCPPGGALVFELRQSKISKDYIVRAYFISQTLDQLRNLTPLTLKNPPAKVQILIPGSCVSTVNLDMDFNTFENIMTEAIDQQYVQPFDEEIPPGVISDVPL